MYFSLSILWYDFLSSRINGLHKCTETKHKQNTKNINFALSIPYMILNIIVYLEIVIIILSEKSKFSNRYFSSL